MIESAIDLLRDPSIRGRSRGEVESALRQMGVDLSDPRIVNELDAFPEE